jgi:hypothetical protein
MDVIGTLVSQEYTGAEMIVTIRLEGSAELAVFCLPASSRGVKVGHPVRVSVPFHEIHLFDRDGERQEVESLPTLLSVAA